MEYDEKIKYVLCAHVLANTRFAVTYLGKRNKPKDTILASSKAFFGLKKLGFSKDQKKYECK